MRHALIVPALILFWLAGQGAGTAQAPFSDGVVYLSFIGTQGEYIRAQGNIAYERNETLQEPTLDWSGTQIVVMKPNPSGALYRAGGVPVRPDGEFGQTIVRAVEQAKRLRDQRRPNGRLKIIFDFVGGMAVRETQGQAAALAVAILAAHDGRRLEGATILGGLDAQGRMTPVSDLNAHLANVLKLGQKKVFVAPGQKREISDQLQQHIDQHQIAIIEAATLADLYTLAAGPSRGT
jgi:hypothetical protein